MMFVGKYGLLDFQHRVLYRVFITDFDFFIRSAIFVADGSLKVCIIELQKVVIFYSICL